MPLQTRPPCCYAARPLHPPVYSVADFTHPYAFLFLHPIPAWSSYIVPQTFIHIVFPPIIPDSLPLTASWRLLMEMETEFTSRCISPSCLVSSFTSSLVCRAATDNVCVCVCVWRRRACVFMPCESVCLCLCRLFIFKPGPRMASVASH